MPNHPKFMLLLSLKRDDPSSQHYIEFHQKEELFDVLVNLGLSIVNAKNNQHIQINKIMEALESVPKMKVFEYCPEKVPFHLVPYQHMIKDFRQYIEGKIKLQNDSRQRFMSTLKNNRKLFLVMMQNLRLKSSD